MSTCLHPQIAYSQEQAYGSPGPLPYSSVRMPPPHLPVFSENLLTCPSPFAKLK